MRRFLTITITALCSLLAVYAEQIDVPDLSIVAGEAPVVEVQFTSERTDLVAFQIDLTLPEGVSLDQEACSLSPRIAEGEQAMAVGMPEPGVYRLTYSSLTLAPIGGTSGPLLTLRLTTAEGCKGGEARISNIRFSTSESERVTAPDTVFNIRLFYHVTFVYGDEVLRTDSVEYGTAIPLPESLDSERYTLVEWLDVPETMPAHDLTLYADFTDGIEKMRGGENEKMSPTAIYDLQGRRLPKLHRGLNLLRYRVGTTRPVMVR